MIEYSAREERHKGSVFLPQIFNLFRKLFMLLTELTFLLFYYSPLVLCFEQRASCRTATDRRGLEGKLK